MKNHTQNVVVTDPFPKNSKLSISLDQQSELLYSLFLLYLLIVSYRKYLEIKVQALAFILFKAFLKNKKKSGTSLPASFFG